MSAAGANQQQLLPAAFDTQSNKHDSELHILRKRQSFSFGDDYVQVSGPAMLASQLHTAPQPPLQSNTASSAAANAAFIPADVHRSSPSLASQVATAAAAMDAVPANTGTAAQQARSKPSIPSMAGGLTKQAGRPDAAIAKVMPTQQTVAKPPGSNKGAVTVASSAVGSSRSKPESVKGRAVARASPAAGPVGPSKTVASQRGTQGPKHAVAQKLDWQH